MKHLIIVSSMLLINSYVFTAEYPLAKKLIRREAFRQESRKFSSVTIHNESNYDIAIPTEHLVINPGESKKVLVPENLELEVFLHALDHSLTLNFKKSVPQNVRFTKKSDLIEHTHDEECIKKYICK